ncbi:MAG: GntR family transcriptional regulator, partial [Desulfobacterales bacterium]
VNALKFLEHEKLIEAIPRRGYFVRLFSKQEMVQIFELREVLEGLAARRAAQHITGAQLKQLEGFFKQFGGSTDITDYKTYAREDRRFHNFVIEVGGKEFLKSILQTYNIIVFSYQVVSSEGLIRPPNETIHEHLAIVAAIRKRDALAAEELMRQHLRKSGDFIQRDIASEKQEGTRRPRAVNQQNAKL